MRSLILIIALLSPFSVAGGIPDYMLYSTMNALSLDSDLIVDVTIDYPLDDLEVVVINDTFTATATTPAISESSYMLHHGVVVNVIKAPAVTGATPSHLITVVGRDIHIEQWRDPDTDESYPGTPVLAPGESYRLYLYNTHGRTERTAMSPGMPIYAVTGVNGGIFTLGATGPYRSAYNNSIIH